MTKIHEYFISERNESIAFVIFAVCGIFFSFYFWIIVNTPFYNGIGWALIALAFFQLFQGVNKFFKTKNIEKKVMSFLKSSKKSIKNIEVPRVKKKSGVFKYFRYAETTLMILSLIFYFVSSDGFWKGLCVGMIIECSILYIANYIAEYRNIEYLKFLKKHYS
ncbi:MAG: hypothetical protein HUU47_08880 [Bacteroidetes bacterium]|nr:hypothetical protein [Bacteroidota bacterium]